MEKKKEDHSLRVLKELREKAQSQVDGIDKAIKLYQQPEGFKCQEWWKAWSNKKQCFMAATEDGDGFFTGASTRVIVPPTWDQLETELVEEHSDTSLSMPQIEQTVKRMGLVKEDEG